MQGIVVESTEPETMIREDNERPAFEGGVPLHVCDQVAQQPINVSQLTPIAVVRRGPQGVDARVVTVLVEDERQVREATSTPEAL